MYIVFLNDWSWTKYGLHSVARLDLPLLLFHVSIYMSMYEYLHLYACACMIVYVLCLSTLMRMCVLRFWRPFSFVVRIELVYSWVAIIGCIYWMGPPLARLPWAQVMCCKSKCIPFLVNKVEIEIELKHLPSLIRNRHVNSDLPAA